MPSIAIYGDSGMSKTMIMKRFRDQHPPSFDKSTGALTTPVLAMEMVSRPGERRFYGELLTLLGAPQSPRADITQMEQAALRIMEANGRLPVVLPPVAGELFSSWIARHATFYGVPALTMLRHCLPDAVSLHINELLPWNYARPV